jgi:hypothetical protein
MNEIGLALTAVAIVMVGALVLREWLRLRKRGAGRARPVVSPRAAPKMDGDSLDDLPPLPPSMAASAPERSLKPGLTPDVLVGGADPLGQSGLRPSSVGASSSEADPLLGLSSGASDATRSLNLGDTHSGVQPELPFVETPPSAAAGGASGGAELILAIHILSPDGLAFDASDVKLTLDESGLEFGSMQIYHHLGVGQSRATHPVFSLARAIEPGHFDPRDLASYATPGLVLFMRLPGRQDGAVVLELMLASAERIARRLEGLLLDQHREPLTTKTVAQMRNSVVRFNEARALSQLTAFARADEGGEPGGRP